MYKNIKPVILKTSYRLFQEKGYDSVTVDDICAEVGITKPTFYKYAGSKDQLLSSFFEGIMSNISQQLEEISLQENYWEKILCAFRIILFQSQEFGSALYSQLFISNLKEDQGTFAIIPELAELMISILGKAQKKGQIHNPSDPAKLYAACVQLCFGYGLTWCINNGSSDLLKDFEEGLAVVLQVDSSLR